MGFTHLNVKTGFSFLEGALPLERLCERVKALGMTSVAVTDKGNLHGAYEFYKTARKSGIKPILGSEIQLLPEGVAIDDKSTRHDTYALTLLARNDVGWRNLKELVSKASLVGYYYVPRIDWDTLSEHAEGLIVLSGGLGGLISRTWHGWHGPRSKRRASTKRYDEEAELVAKKLSSLCSPGDFYLEFQDTGLPEEPAFNEFLWSIKQRLGLPGVATNNCHYLDEDDAEAHRYLMCIQYRTTIDKFDGPEISGRYLKDELAMKSGWCANYPELLSATDEIAERCSVHMELGVNYLPPFPCDDGRNEEEELRHSALKGLKKRFVELQTTAAYAFDEQVYLERLEHELTIINSMGFPGYFLIVQDFINWAKDHSIRVGPGRGSGAGSIVAWALRITDLDPLPYDLLFERFLNPERVSMPDFDVDFCQERRGEVIQYVTEKYGADRVGQIATFARLGGKSVIKDVASVLDMPFAQINDMTRNIPAFHEGLPVTLTPKIRNVEGVEVVDGRLVGDPNAVSEARKSWGLFEVSSELLEQLKAGGKLKKVFDIATRLEGLYRQAGTHAGGVLIGRDVLTEYTPVFATSSGGQAAQFNMEGVEDVGLVKFDFLGLKNLDIITYAEDLVNEEISRANAATERERADLIQRFPHLRGADPKAPLEKLDIDLVPLDHAEPYELISSGDTNGIFQLESDGMKSMLVELKPDCFEDIVAAVALYRPGPMDQIPDYIKRKHGQLAIEYPHAALAEVLKPTYGHMVYQEQVMQAAQIMGGYTLGSADILRRAMGKKKREEMEKQRLVFTQGALDLHDLPKPKAGKIFDVMEKFAGYGFNKSHAAAYAKIAYQTAYLKRFHPVAFYCAQVTVHRNKTDTVTKYLREADDKGIQILPPCVNASSYGFRPEGAGAIRFGLCAVKGVGDAVLNHLFSEQNTDKPFIGLLELVERCGPRELPRKATELLVDAGALDFCGASRRRLISSLDTVYQRAGNTCSDREAGQFSFFEMGTMDGGTASDPSECLIAAQLEWPDRLRLARERAVLGFFLSGHPTRMYEKAFKRLTTCSCVDLSDLWEPEKGWGNKRKTATIGGVIVARDIKNIATYSGGPKEDTVIPRRAFLTVEDTSGQVEIRLEPEVFEQFEELIKSDEPLVFSGNLMARKSGGGDDGDEQLEVGLRANQVHRAFEVFEQQRIPFVFSLDLKRHTPHDIEGLKSLCSRFPGAMPPEFRIAGDHGRLRLLAARELSVACHLELMDEVEELLGKGSVQLG